MGRSIACRRSPPVCRVATAAVTIALLAAAPAGAIIHVNKGMAGVELGMTRDKIVAKFGQPDKANPSNVGTIERYSPRKLTVLYGQDGTVTSVGTTGRKERTAHGVGVGSTKAAVLKGVARAHCQGALCSVQTKDNKRTTIFTLLHGRVTIVGVIDISAYTQNPA